MRDVDVALSDISSIRAQLLATTRFRGISPAFNTVLGVLVFVVALVQALGQPEAGQGNIDFILVWATVLVASTSIVALEAVSRSRRLHGKMAKAMLMSVFSKVVPFGLSGIAISLVFCSFATDVIHFLPGIWLIFIGLFGFSIVSHVPKGLVWVANWYLISGVCVLYLSAQSGVLSPWMMGIPLAVGQLAAAYFLNGANGVNRG